MAAIYRFIAKRGFLKGNGTFAAIASVIAILKFLHKLSGGAPKTLYTHELEPGQVIVVTDKQVGKKKKKK